MKKAKLFSLITEEKNITFEKNYLSFGWLFNIFLFAIIIAFLIIFIRLFNLTIVKGNYYQQLAKKNRLREIYIEAPRGTIFDRNHKIIAESLWPNPNLNQDRIQSFRKYHYQESVAHLVGFLQIADKNDLKKDSCLPKLVLGDRIGKMGIEKIYECQLRGTAGKKIIEVDATGKKIKTLAVVEPRKGSDLKLTIDLDIQEVAYNQIKDKKGAIIVSNPNTGEVLALVSIPSFNPENIKDYINNPDKPLINRVTEGVYPPGSIFKLVVAAAALEEKKINEKTVFEDTGILQAGPLKFGNWYFLQYGKTEGLVDVIKGIQRSNDIFFYQIGKLVGPDKIKIWAEKFGYGEIDKNFPFSQLTGQIPSPFWKREKYKENWYLGDTYNISIGQGEILVTPLQVNKATSILARDGYDCPLTVIKENKNPNCKKINLSKKTLQLIKEGMEKACAPGGTGWPLFDFKINLDKKNKDKKATESANFKKINVSCKTGTAESQSKDHLPHAWITIYAPSENPEIVLTVLVENGGQGSDVAGPIAKEILTKYFEKKFKKN